LRISNAGYRCSLTRASKACIRMRTKTADTKASGFQCPSPFSSWSQRGESYGSSGVPESDSVILFLRETDYTASDEQNTSSTQIVNSKCVSVWGRFTHSSRHRIDGRYDYMTGSCSGILRFFSAIAPFLISVSIAIGQSTYTYSGHTFTISPPPPSTGLVTLSITMKNPLGNNVSQAFVSPTSWTMNNGSTTISSADSRASIVALLWTDSSGNIISWQISGFNSTGLTIASCFIPYQCGFDYTDQKTSDGNHLLFTGQSTIQGTWTKNVVAPPPLASPSSLTFNAVQGSAPPPLQTLVLGASLTPGTMITSSSTPPSWLNVGWISVGSAPMSIPISINPSFTNLAPGSYTTSLVFVAPFDAQNATVQITLNVSAPPPTLRTNVTQLQFQYVTGGATPVTQSIQVTSSSSPLTASLSLSVPWLTSSASTGTTPFTTNIGVNPSGLGVGTYTGRVTVATNAASVNSSSQSIDVTLTVAADTRPVITSVVNAASFRPVISPGAWISIMGKNFGPVTDQATSAWLSTSMDGISAQLSGPGGAYSLLVDYVSPTQINAFVPHEISPLMWGAAGNATISIAASAGTASYSVDCEGISPALFSYGTNTYAAAVFPDGVIAGTIFGTRPATAGSIISLYGTGFGQTNPIASNINGPVTVRPLALDATVTVGGVPAKVLWAGMVGIGLYQFNIEVPAMSAPADYPVLVQIGGTSSPAVNLPVR